MQLKKSFGERAKSIIGGGNKPGKQIDIDTNEDTFFSFLCKCEQSLDGISDPQRVFDMWGNPIHTIHELIAGETYFISEVTTHRIM